MYLASEAANRTAYASVPDQGEDATITISTGLAERALYPVQTGGEIGPAYGSIEPPM